eukprot:878274_1
MPTTMNPSRVPTSDPLACSGGTADLSCQKTQELTIGAGESTKYCWTTTTCEELTFSGATGERLYFILKLAEQNVIKKRIFTLGTPEETYFYVTNNNAGYVANVEFIVKNEGTVDLMFLLDCDC